MINQDDFLKQIQLGALPPAGIIRRSPGAKDLVITTQVDGETVVVPDVDLFSIGPVSEQTEGNR